MSDMNDIVDYDFTDVGKIVTDTGDEILCIVDESTEETIWRKSCSVTVVEDQNAGVNATNIGLLTTSGTWTKNEKYSKYGQETVNGSKTIIGNALWGETIRVDASPSEYYKVTNVHVGGTDLGPIKDPYEFTITSDVVISAQCILPATGVTVAVSPNGTGASAIGGGDFPIGSTQTIQITGFDNGIWQFLKWDDGNTKNPRTITVTGQNQTYIGTLEKKTYITQVSMK